MSKKLVFTIIPLAREGTRAHNSYVQLVQPAPGQEVLQMLDGKVNASTVQRLILKIKCGKKIKNQEIQMTITIGKNCWIVSAQCISC